MLKSVWSLFILLLSTTAVFASDFDNKFSQAEIREKLKTMVKHSEVIDQQIEVTDKYFFLYASAEDKAAKKHEFKVRLRQNGDELEKEERNKRRSLKGLKIAIDPGHFGGKYSSAEERKIRADLPSGHFVEFNEGDINLATGLQLKKMLEGLGAKVFITKTKLSEGAIGVDFNEWRNGEGFEQAVEDYVSQLEDSEREAARKWWKEKATDNTIFRRLFNPMDLKARSDLLMDFGADLTFVIHYNAGSLRNKEENKNILTKENYSMFFTGGSYLRGELATEDSRNHFMRQLFSNMVEESKELSVFVIKEVIHRVGVNPVSQHNDFPQKNYLNSVCVHQCDGVYARNMQLTRGLPGVLCYTEPLLMDNELMAAELGKTNHIVDGMRTSPLTKTLAEAYFAATKKFYKIED